MTARRINVAQASVGEAQAYVAEANAKSWASASPISRALTSCLPLESSTTILFNNQSSNFELSLSLQYVDGRWVGKRNDPQCDERKKAQNSPKFP